MALSASVQTISFGDFEVKLRSRELCRNGLRVRLPDQSFQVLAMLLERPGELVTREEIRKRLWPRDTFVDFDHGLNNAVNRLRAALRDSAENPRFIETLPRRGYRFIGAFKQQPVDSVFHEPFPQPGGREPPSVTKTHWKSSIRYAWVAAGVAALAVGCLLALKYLSSPGGPPKPIRSLAVLPLDNLSGDSAQDYFADGVTEALIAQLSHIGSLRVISRSSVVGYKGLPKPIAQIARDLNVDAVIEGSVVRSGNRVRIYAQLIQATPERHLWANTYERNASDILELQGDLVQAIAREIQVELTPRERANFAAHRTVNSEAYNSYLLGRYFLDRAGKENLERALAYYQQATQLDTNYAPAWAGLADAYRLLGGGGHVPAQTAEKNSRVAVERAIELDPDLAEAHAALGSIQTFIDWDWTAAKVSFDRALSLEPGNYSALRGAAVLAATLGRFDDALDLARKAVERDPLNPRSYRVLAEIAQYAGRWDEALSALQRSVQLNPQGIYAHTDIAWIYLAQSHPRAALEEVMKETSSERYLLGLTVTNYALGEKKKSDAALAKLISTQADISAFQIAQAYAFRGERDQALSWLDRAYRQRDGALVTVSGDPLLKNLRGDPRYSEFLKKMRLPN